MESLVKKKKEYMPPRFMSVSEAARQLLEIVKKRSETTGNTQLNKVNFIALKSFSEIREDSLSVGLARVGADSQQIVVCSLKKMAEVDLGKPLHSLIIPGPILHPLEQDYLNKFKL